VSFTPDVMDISSVHATDCRFENELYNNIDRELDNDGSDNNNNAAPQNPSYGRKLVSADFIFSSLTSDLTIHEVFRMASVLPLNFEQNFATKAFCCYPTGG